MSSAILFVHPEHLSLCFLVSALVAPPPEQLGWGIGFDAPTAQRLLALFLLEEIQDASSPTLSTLPVLLTRLQRQLGKAGTVLAQALVTSLGTLVSPDDITNVFQGFISLLAPAGTTPPHATDASSIAFIATSSPLGLFLRRVRLGLSSMSVQALAGLAGQIQQQLQTLELQLAMSNSSIDGTADDPAAPGCTSGAGAGAVGGSAVPAAASSTALKEQSVLEAYLNNLMSAVENQGQNLPASAVAAATAPLAGLEEQLPKLEYLQLAVHLAHRDMHAALAALHRYFDNSGSSTGSAAAGAAMGAAASAGAASVGAAAAAVGQGSRGKGRHQAALQSLSGLHAELGHQQESFAALAELLRLGQQQGDEWGLLHALAGMCRVMSMSEGLTGGLQPSAAAAVDGTSSSSSWTSVDLLSLQQVEQQLQLQALLQRCLDTARDIRAPHIAAFAAVAICRHRLQHVSGAGSSSNGSTAAGAAQGSEADRATGAGAAASPSLTVQRMLLDVATLEHHASAAAAAPSTAAAGAAAAAAGGPGIGQTLAARSADLYNPSEAFGTGTSTAVPGSVTAAGPTSKAQPPGLGWRASAAAVSQALATAELVAAAALQRQGANSLAAVKLLMLLTGPGGAGAYSSEATAGCTASAEQQQQRQSVTAVKAPRGCSMTGCSIRCADIAAAWALLIEFIMNSRGPSAAEHTLSLALSHFPVVIPPVLVAVQQQLLLHRALQSCDLAAAQLACEELQSLAQPLPQLDLQLQLVAAEASALVKAASGSWLEAHAAAATLFGAAAGAGMQQQAVSALLLMGRACLAAGDAAGALPYALSVLLHCQQLQLDMLLPEAVLLLAGAWQGLSPAGGLVFVEQLLQQVLPLACAAGSLKVKGRLEVGVAKVLLAQLQHHLGASSSVGVGPLLSASASSTSLHVPSPSAEAVSASGVGKGSWGGQHDGLQQQQQQGTAVLKQVIGRLQAAAAVFEQAGMWSEEAEVWLLLAHVLNAVGFHEEERNEAAARWQAAQQHLHMAAMHLASC